MKFEASRVIQTTAELSDARFKGPTARDRALAFLADGFHAIRWQVQRREVRGSSARDLVPVLVARPAVNSPAAVRVVFMASWRSPRRKPKSSTDEYSGPAFLLELARSWPASRSDRIETICVVGAMPEVGHVVTQRILSLIETESSAKPTLLVTVYGPGIGPELVIDARRHRAFVEAAARDLWIPLRTRSVNPLSSLGFFQAFRDRNEDDVRISGSRPGGETVTELDGGALDRTAQLCTEIALRWARQQSQEPRAPGEDRTASRSSQKPG